jgi:hypothetical protein
MKNDVGVVNYGIYDTRPGRWVLFGLRKIQVVKNEASFLLRKLRKRKKKFVKVIISLLN